MGGDVEVHERGVALHSWRLTGLVGLQAQHVLHVRQRLRGAVELVEMERIKEYSWCCGSGGGAKSAYPDFALATAKERVEEAEATGAEFSHGPRYTIVRRPRK